MRCYIPTLNRAGKGIISTLLNAVRGVDCAEWAGRDGWRCYRSFNIQTAANVLALSIGAPF